MKHVAKFYQIAVVITDNEKRMVAAVKNEDDKSEVVLNLSGEEAVNGYSSLLDVINQYSKQN